MVTLSEILKAPNKNCIQEIEKEYHINRNLFWRKTVGTAMVNHDGPKFFINSMGCRSRIRHYTQRNK